MAAPAPTNALTQNGDAAPSDDGGLTLRGEVRLDADEVALIRELRP